MYHGKHFIISIFLFLITQTDICGQTIQSAIKSDFASGTISIRDKMYYNALAILNPSQLPVKYRGLKSKPVKSGTFILYDLKKYWHTFTDEQKTILSNFLYRPNLPNSIISESGTFKIHYTTTGYDATTDSFATEVAQTFDYTYQIEVTELNYPAPPSDDGIDGPEYDIYIQSLNAYGWTMPEYSIPSTPRDDWITFIKIDNDFAPGQNYFTEGLDAMRVTASHEFFHAIHFGVRAPIDPPYSDSDRFFYEVSAVWMEDKVWDEINDYYQYFFNLGVITKSYYNSPGLAFNTFNDWREYGLSVWNHYLDKKYGTDTIRRIWEYMLVTNGIDAMKRMLSEKGAVFADAFAEFHAWNYFTAGTADETLFYEEGSSYPRIKVEQTIDLTSTITHTDSTERLSGKYYKIINRTASNVLSIQLNAEHNSTWRIAAIFQPASGMPEISIVTPPEHVNFTNTSAGDTLIVIPVNVEYTNKHEIVYTEPKHSFSFSVSPDSGSVSEGKESHIISVNHNPFFLGLQNSLATSLYISKESEVTAYVLDQTGRPIVNKYLGFLPKGYGHTWDWNGRNNNGDFVANGIYILLFKIGDIFAKQKVAIIRK